MTKVIVQRRGMRLHGHHHGREGEGQEGPNHPGHGLRDGEKAADRYRFCRPMVTLAGFADNPVYRSAAKHLKHVACPVPSAILKAIETESGMNVPKDVRIEFVGRNDGVPRIFHVPAVLY